MPGRSVLTILSPEQGAEQHPGQLFILGIKEGGSWVCSQARLGPVVPGTQAGVRTVGSVPQTHLQAPRLE